MRFVVCFLLALALLIIQSISRHLFVPEWCVPQGLLVCVVFLAFHEFSLFGVVASFFLGLLLDLSSGILLGPWAGAYVVVYALFAFLSQRLFVESLMVSMSVVALATLVSGFLFISLAFEYQAVTVGDLVMLAGQAAASALITPYVFKILRWSWRRPDRALTGRGSTKRGTVVSVV